MSDPSGPWPLHDLYRWGCWGHTNLFEPRWGCQDNPCKLWRKNGEKKQSVSVSILFFFLDSFLERMYGICMYMRHVKTFEYLKFNCHIQRHQGFIEERKWDVVSHENGLRFRVELPDSPGVFHAFTDAKAPSNCLGLMAPPFHSRTIPNKEVEKHKNRQPLGSFQFLE